MASNRGQVDEEVVANDVAFDTHLSFYCPSQNPPTMLASRSCWNRRGRGEVLAMTDSNKTAAAVAASTPKSLTALLKWRKFIASRGKMRVRL